MVVFLYGVQRFRKSEREPAQIHRSPLPIRNIVISREIRVVRQQYVLSSRMPDILQCFADIGIRKVYQAVTTHNEISGRKRIGSQIKYFETPAFRRVLFPIVLNKFGNDIRTGICNTFEIEVPHPVKIAAGNIQHGADRILPEQLMEWFQQRL